MLDVGLLEETEAFCDGKRDAAVGEFELDLHRVVMGAVVFRKLFFVAEGGGVRRRG